MIDTTEVYCRSYGCMPSQFCKQCIEHRKEAAKQMLNRMEVLDASPRGEKQNLMRLWKKQ